MYSYSASRVETVVGHETPITPCCLSVLPAKWWLQAQRLPVYASFVWRRHSPHQTSEYIGGHLVNWFVTARRYDNAVCAMALSIRLSVCLSQSQLIKTPCKQRRRMPKILVKFKWAVHCAGITPNRKAKYIIWSRPRLKSAILVQYRIISQKR